MTFVSRLHLIAAGVALASACGPDAAPTTSAETGTTTSSSGSSAGTRDGTGAVDTGSTETGSVGSSSDGGGTTGSSSSDTGVEITCVLEEQVAEQLDASKTEPVDCGGVTDASPDEQWIAVHDCVLDSQANGLPFVATYELAATDTLNWGAYIGLDGAEYSTAELVQSSGLFGGPPTPVVMRDCGMITALEPCEPGYLHLCLDCGEGRAVELCNNS